MHVGDAPGEAEEARGRMLMQPKVILASRERLPVNGQAARGRTDARTNSQCASKDSDASSWHDTK